jgi:H/ACA ribonucleoprotein complex subunit 4
MDVVSKQEDEHIIKPQAVTPAIDTSSWPLLLKNYEKRESGIARGMVSLDQP